LSNAAVGFSGLYRLAEATGHNPRIVRNTHDFDSEDLLVISPDDGWINISEQLEPRGGKPTLFILPKWSTQRDPDHSGWVRSDGFLQPENPGALLSPGIEFTIARHKRAQPMLVSAPELAGSVHFAAPRLVQVIKSFTIKKGETRTKLHPLVTDGAGGIVVGQLGPGPLFIVADPDLLSNAGIRDPRQAQAALALLDWLNSTGSTSIGFDVTSNGLGRSRSPLKLAFDPPFLAATLLLATAMGLLGWHAFGRFGPVKPRARAIAFGKKPLVDNSAAIIKRARREAQLGGRYVQMIRDRAALAFAIPPRIKDDALDAYLDKLGGGTSFSDLARAVEAAEDPVSLAEAARALHDWQREKMGAG